MMPDQVSSPNWRLRLDTSLLDPVTALMGDEKLLQDIATGRQPATARIWRSQPCLVVPARQRDHPCFAAAATALSKTGWPIVTRRSGGSAIPLDSGVVNISLAFQVPAASTHPWRIDDGFQLLASTLIGALAEFDLTITVGMVPGAFCNGRFDLAVGSRKIAGTAQHYRSGHDASGRQLTVVLAHAALFVANDLRAGAAALNQWETALGLVQHHRVNCLSTVQRALLPKIVTRDRLMTQMIAALVRSVSAKRAPDVALPETSLARRKSSDVLTALGGTPAAER